MLAWVTPDDPPGENVCLQVYCPAGSEYEAALRGAILSLTEAENWEQVGTQTIETVASAFFDAYQLTLVWGECIVPVDEIPVGAVFWGAWESAPDGYLFCDGTGYSTTEYPELFAEIGYNFGGSGGTFNVPDFSGRFPIGADITRAPGDSGGAEAHTLTIDEIPAHDHDVDKNAAVGPQIERPTYALGRHEHAKTGLAGGGLAHNNMPPWLAMYAVIKA